MAVTSGTTAFNLDLNDLFEEAFERAGLEIRTGYEFRTARRSLNMLTIEWANRGINLWTVEQGQFTMVTGQAIYALPNDTIDLLDQVIRTQPNMLNQTDINISRISEPTYSTIPNKLAQGRPIQVWVNRQSGNVNAVASTVATAVAATDTTIYLSDVTVLPAAGCIKLDDEVISYSNVTLTGTAAGYLSQCGRGQQNTLATTHSVGTAVNVAYAPTVNVWPTPNAPGDQYTFVYWRMRRLQDAGSGTNIQDIPFRLIPCLVAGLAFYIAAKRTDVPPERIAFLKDEYEQQWLLASQEDREKAPDRYVPRTLFYS